MVDLSDFPCEYEEGTNGADTGEETATMLDPEADCTAYNDETIAASEETLQSILEKVYKKNQEKNRKELDYSKAPKVLVTADKIKELIPETCHVCGSAISLQHTMSGTVLILNWNCDNGHLGNWASSDVLTVKNHQKVYVNNIQLAAAILLSGNNFQKFSLLSKFLGLEIISETLFYRIQKLYCSPAIKNMWNDVKGAIHQHFLSTGLTLSGDGRNDSPGHTARYCVYTLMEETQKLVVDLEVVDKRETGGKSATMEKLALSRLLQRLKGVLKIDHLVTDASTSIKALVRDLKGTYYMYILLIYVSLMSIQCFFPACYMNL